MYDKNENYRILNKNELISYVEENMGCILKKNIKKYNDESLRFMVSSESRLNNILSELGGVNIANNNGILIYILPLNN